MRQRTWRYIDWTLKLLLFSSLLGWYFLDQHFFATRPHGPSAETHQVMAVSYHGAHYYLTLPEFVFFWSLPLIAVLSIVVFSLCSDRSNRN